MSARYPAIAVYIMASRRNGTIYVGVTSNLEQREAHHKQGLYEGFSKRHGCKNLVWYEMHGEMTAAIQQEKTLKRYNRSWKLRLIEGENPDWNDLAADWWS